MGKVVRLANFRTPADATARCVAAAGQPEFTARDLGDLREWAASGCQVSLCACELGAFAMLYRDGTPWASWGVVRQAETLLVWDCVKLTDVGRFPSMREALRAIPVARGVTPIASVVPFPVHQRRAASG